MQSYCVTRKVLLAAVKAFEQFRHYLLGRHFVVRTDHAALQWLLHFKNPEGQIARWLEKLQEYDFEVRHRPGNQHGNADALSRRPCGDCSYCRRVEIKELTEAAEDKTVTASLVHVTEVTEPEPDTLLDEDALQRAQEHDEAIGPIIRWLKEERRPDWEEIAAGGSDLKWLWAQWDSLEMRRGLLMRRWEGTKEGQTRMQVILPLDMRVDAMTYAHDLRSSGHFGIKRTLERLRQRVYWINMRADVEEWCRSCEVCSARKGPGRKGHAKLKSYTVGLPWERLALDVMGPLPCSKRGNRYILVSMDYFTKWPEAFAMPNQEAETIAEVLVREIVSRFGVPLELHSDQGRNFESKVFRRLCELIGVKKTRTTPLHPQSDGMVERFNGTLLNYLGKFVSERQQDWDEHLPYGLMAYRSSVHQATGQTPAKLMLGRELRTPLELLYGNPPEDIEQDVPEYLSRVRKRVEVAHGIARSQLKLAGDRMKTRYNRTALTRSFEPGEQVWLYNPTRKKGICPKLSCPWKGPFRVEKRINDLVYRIRLTPAAKQVVVHVDRLAPYKKRQGYMDGNYSGGRG